MAQLKHLYHRLVCICSSMVAGTSLFAASSPAQLPGEVQQDTLGNRAFVFSEDTVVEFEVKETHGAYQSTVGIVNLDRREQTVLFREVKPYDGYGDRQRQPASPGVNNTGTPIDYLGTVGGGTIVNGEGNASSLIEFTFKAGERYSLYLESVSPTGATRRTVQAINLNAAQFQGGLDSGQDNELVGTRISWDDQGLPRPGKDNDFDDFVLEAGGYLIKVTCPQVQ